MLNELIDNYFLIIIVAIFKTGERTYTDNVTVTTHYRDCFQQVFRFIAIHDDATFCFQFPCSLIYIENHYVHTQVKGCFLGTQACPQAGIEENHH